LSDLVKAKLQPPWTRPGTVWRSSLLEQLMHGDPRPIVSVVAPAGYGKTTLLSQWARHSSEAFAWVSVDEADNDPKVLLTYIAEALDAVEPIGERVFDALASLSSSALGLAVPRLGAAFASMTSTVTLVLDDVHVLHNNKCRAALSMLAEHVPRGSRLALAGRDRPPLRIPRLRAEGRVVEIGPGDLSFTREEASSLLYSAGVALDAEEVAALYQRTEGWPAGLYLAVRYLRESGCLPGTVVTFGGDDLLVSEYLESEFLARIPAGQRQFLTRTAVLERMCGPLCEAVLGQPGSAATLADLARSNLLLVPLDRRGQWYRYHHLFRDMLLAELERQAPELISVLRRRAVGWCLRNGLPEEALEYSIAAGNADTAARLVEKLWIPTYREGRIATVQRWLGWLEKNGTIQAHPVVVAAASLTSATTGRPAEAEWWADMLDCWYEDPARPDDAYAEASAVLIRALLCRRGIGQMLGDAEEAWRRFSAQGIAYPIAAVLRGIAHFLSGNLDGADACIEDAIRIVGEADDSHEIRAIALSERSLLATANADWPRAELLANQALTVMCQGRIEESYVAPLVRAARARALLHRRDVPAARQELISAQRPRPLLTYALPYFAVQARIELARAHLALADLAGARTLMREIDELLKRRPGLGTLIDEAGALRAQLAKERGSAIPGPSALTAAELRLLPLLSTHLALHEIAAKLVLSPHTVRTQGKSIYRKLGAAGRSQAVARARELGLLEG
jgi:LuxR family transcriptional regulator, maltose regulon positive regulatory protein